MENYMFQPIIEVQEMGAQVSGVKIFLGKTIDKTSLSLNSFSFFICSENTNNIWQKIPITGLEVINSNTVYLKLFPEQDYLPKKVLQFIQENFTQSVCHMKYKMQQNSSIFAQDGVEITKDTIYKLRTPERIGIDDFVQVSFKDMSYSIYSPKIKADKHPLIIWLHGAGEGGHNTSNIMADKGAVTYLKKDTQYLFGGAYILAPQCPTYWLKNFAVGGTTLHGDRDYTADLYELLIQILNKYKDIDKSRIYVAGASMGSWQGLCLMAENADLFAGAILSCPAQIPENKILDAIKDIPIWFLHCNADDTVPIHNTEYIYGYLKQTTQADVRATYYPEVVVQGKKVNQHCVFFYMYESLPEENGESLFNWLSNQKKGLK